MWTSCGQPKSDDLARPLVLSDVMGSRDEQAVIQTTLENRSIWMMLRAGHSIVIFDNFCNSHREVVNRIGHIAGGARRSSTVISAIASC
jgi:hypothetical protein